MESFFLLSCEAATPYDYALLVIAATGWCYAAFCMIQLRYERQSPLVWWEPVPLGTNDLTARGKAYHRRFFLAFMAGTCALLLAVALCATR
jgi:hypothetical protein